MTAPSVEEQQRRACLAVLSSVLEVKLRYELRDPRRALRALDDALLGLCALEPLLLHAIAKQEATPVKTLAKPGQNQGKIAPSAVAS